MSDHFEFQTKPGRARMQNTRCSHLNKFRQKHGNRYNVFINNSK